MGRQNLEFRQRGPHFIVFKPSTTYHKCHLFSHKKIIINKSDSFTMCKNAKSVQTLSTIKSRAPYVGKKHACGSTKSNLTDRNLPSLESNFLTYILSLLLNLTISAPLTPIMSHLFFLRMDQIIHHHKNYSFLEIPCHDKNFKRRTLPYFSPNQIVEEIKD